MGSAILGILSLLSALQVETHAGISLSEHPSQRLRSISVANRSSSLAWAVFGRASPDKAAAPAEAFRKDRRLIFGILDNSMTFSFYDIPMYRVSAF
jgi:hypothetical protein